MLEQVIMDMQGAFEQLVGQFEQVVSTQSKQQETADKLQQELMTLRAEHEALKKAWDSASPAPDMPPQQQAAAQQLDPALMGLG